MSSSTLLFFTSKNKFSAGSVIRRYICSNNNKTILRSQQLMGQGGGPVAPTSASRILRSIVQVQGRHCRRLFSQQVTKSITSVHDCAGSLSDICNRGSISVLELSKQLSPSARNEISLLAKSFQTQQTLQQQFPSAAVTAASPVAIGQPEAAIVAAATAAAQHQDGIVPVPRPSFSELRMVAFTASLPFVGFGFLDNAVLIIAGDYIDTSLHILSVSTLCAAAIGNIISDLSGLGLGTVIEDFCYTYFKFCIPNLTSQQRNLRVTRFASQFGCAVGMVFGCILGMFPLLFIDGNHSIISKNKSKEEEKKERGKIKIFEQQSKEQPETTSTTKMPLFHYLQIEKRNLDSLFAASTRMTTSTTSLLNDNNTIPFDTSPKILASSPSALSGFAFDQKLGIMTSSYATTTNENKE